MKTFITILLLFIFLTGCDNSRNHELLSMAEQKMSTQPDSALHILKSVKVDNLSNANRAKYALLLSQAYDKNYIDITEDSLVNIAVNYYSEHRDEHNLMLAYFYQGRVYMNGGSYAPAICSFLNSLELAEQREDYFWCGKNCEQLSDIYSWTYHSGDEEIYAKQAYEYYKKSGNELFVRYAAQNLAKAYLNSRNLAEALDFAQKTDSMALVAGDSVLMTDARMIIVKCRYLEGDYKGALEIARDLDSWDEDFKYFTKIIETKLGNISEVPHFDADTCTSAPFLNYVYETRKNEGDYLSAMTVVNRLLALEDSVLCMSLNHKFSNTISDYYRVNIKAKEVEANYQRLKHITLIAVLLILFLIGFYISCKKIKEQKKLIAKNVMIAQNLQDILDLTNIKFQDVEKEIRQLLSENYASIDVLFSSYFENASTKALEKKISSEVEKLIKDFSVGGSKVEKLQYLVDLYYDNIVSKLKEDLPKLKEADYLIFLYTILGFSLTAIALFLGEVKMESVYNRKARLKTKIKNLETPRREEYLHYFDNR